MKLEECKSEKNAFNLKEWKRCHSDWRVIDVVTWHVCGWQWVTITARKGHGKTFEAFHFNNKEEKVSLPFDFEILSGEFESNTLKPYAVVVLKKK